MKKILIVLCFLLIGCAGKQMTRQDQMDFNNKKIKAATREYKNIPKETIVDAMVKVLTLMDSADASFEYSNDGFIMERYFMLFAVLNATYGYDYWIINFDEKTPETISATVIVTSVFNVGLVIGPPARPVLSNIKPIDTVLSEAEAMLFFNRVDYFLGKNDQWISCKEALAFAESNNYKTNYYDFKGKIFGHYPYICGDNYIGIEDNRPN